MKPGRGFAAALALAAAAALAAPAAEAHLMVAQHGTLNLVGDGGFMVLSLPVSAFDGIDDDRDGALSPAELQSHSATIASQLRQGVQLSGAEGPRPLDGLMLYLSEPQALPSLASHDLIVLGRFAIGEQPDRLRLKLSIFGTAAAERSQQITVTRGDQTQLLVFAPGRESHRLLPTPPEVLIDYTLLGAQHILTGFDHLLFLLVVLAAGLSLRQLLYTLTAFTLGHALTLAASVLGGWSAPAAIVEPAIALTIIAMAAYDRWSRTRPVAGAAAVRLALVLACALIHGLALAGALSDAGLDQTHRALSLAGFNLGVEAGQLLVAVPMLLLLQQLQRSWDAARLEMSVRFASTAAMALASFWLVERVSAGG